jgi:hypothetical protein
VAYRNLSRGTTKLLENLVRIRCVDCSPVKDLHVGTASDRRFKKIGADSSGTEEFVARPLDRSLRIWVKQDSPDVSASPLKHFHH